MQSFIDYISPHNGSPLVRSGTGYRDENGTTYPIVDGIPRFVDPQSYADHFGAQWKRFRKTQLDSHIGWTHSRDRLEMALGEDLWQGLAGKQVLEVGCGAGRFTEVLLERGARVLSTDLSAAVEANAENFPPSETHSIAQADLMRMPLPPVSFELVICLGVVQHTPDSRKSIAELFRYVKPGGWMVFDHYHRSLWSGSLTRVGMHLARAYAKNLSQEQAFAFCDRLVRFFFPIQKRIGNRPLLQKLFGRLSPIIVYFHRFPELSEETQFELSLLDTHDSLTDYYKSLLNKSEIEEILESLHPRTFWTEYGHNGVVARAQKPL